MIPHQCGYLIQSKDVSEQQCAECCGWHPMLPLYYSLGHVPSFQAPAVSGTGRHACIWQLCNIAEVLHVAQLDTLRGVTSAWKT
jgi:hypothetical protein